MGDKVTTTFGAGTTLCYKSIFDMYTIELDWRPLDIQIEEHTKYITAVENETEPERSADEIRISVLETVFEEDDETVATIPDTDQNELNVHEDGNGESQKALTPEISNGSDESPHSPPSLIDKKNYLVSY